MTVSSGLSDVLFAVLVGVFPIWDWIEVKRLRSASDVKVREFYYWRIITVEWALTILAIALIGWQKTLSYGLLTRPTWLPAQSFQFEIGILAAFLGGLSVPIIVTARRSTAASPMFTKQLAAIDYLLPKTRTQRVLFLLVSLTAGICEEVIFRAFAIHYLVGLLPLAPLWVCIALAALLFGLIHLGQRVSGVVSTGFLGILFGVLYVAFGLWVPIVLHIALDARFAFLPLREEIS